MTWTANKLPATKNANNIVQQKVEFASTEPADTAFVGSYEIHAARYFVGWPDALIYEDLDKLNATVDVSVIPVGVPVRSVIKLPDPPTQDELDIQTFLALITDYEKKVSEVKGGIGKSTQSDVDAAYLAMKLAYKDEYARYLVGVF